MIGRRTIVCGSLGLLVGSFARSAAAAPVSGDSARGRADERMVRALVLLVVLTDSRPGSAAFPAGDVDAIEAELRRVYQVEVRRLTARPLPRSAFYAPRRRYRADTLLTYLAGEIPAELISRPSGPELTSRPSGPELTSRPSGPELTSGTRILGLTTADISTSKDNFKDWGVFGLGDLGGPAAMVSNHRLRRRARDAAHATARVVNTAVHELGHVLGLEHCEEANCVMLDAQGGIANTDASTGVPGPQCRAELDREEPLRPLSELLRGTAQAPAK